MEKMYEMSHIGRPIDPRYPTNLAIVIWSAVVAVAIFVFRLIGGVELIEAGISAIVASASVFYVWAMSREIDPQEQLSAFVSAILMTIAVFVLDIRFNLIVLFYIMSMSRIVNRSVGLPALINDSIILLVFTGAVSILGSWVYGLIGVLAFLLDSRLPDRDPKHLVFAGLSLVIMGIAFFIQSGQFAIIMPSTEYLIAMIITTLISIPLIVKSSQVDVVCDITGEPIIAVRVQALQVLVLVIAYFIAVMQGNTGVLDFLPLWVSIAGVSLFPLVKPFLPNWDLSPRS